MINKNVKLEVYNKSEIKQLGMCRLTVMNGHHSRFCSFFVEPDRCKPIIGLTVCASLGMVSIKCPVTDSWSIPMSLDREADELDTDETGVKMSKLMKVSLINNPKFSKHFTGVGHFPIKPVDIKLIPNTVPYQTPLRWGPITLQEKFKDEIKSMEKQGIISKLNHNMPKWLNRYIIIKSLMVAFIFV